MVETSFDIAFQNPYRGFLFGENGKALFNGIVCASADTESVRIRVGIGFCDGFQCEFVECLHSAIRHSRDAEGTHFPILFGDVMTSERLGLVAAPMQF